VTCHVPGARGLYVRIITLRRSPLAKASNLLPTMSSLLSRLPSALVRRSAARYLSTAEAAAAATSMTLNFSLPHETVYAGAQVEQVIVPGESGEYGVTVNHVPIVSQLKPGVLQIMFEDGEPEKYFVSGGFALTHENSVTVSPEP
jgi:hypothetical protein